MIEVRDLVRAFGPTKAVDKISFSVARGDIVGFLGPNGAGKTTTLRMVTGYLPPTSGDVTIEGYRSSENGKEVRRLIGYLPESNPLYEEMRVHEYLSFRAALKGIKRSKRRVEVSEALDRCDIAEVRTKLIRNCSKGYRQRVGLADALLGSPPVLILDEPTVGLDPGQIVHTRELIKNLAEDHTVILSTHILPEIEAICSRTIIIHQGKLLFDGSVEELGKSKGAGRELICSLDADGETARSLLASVPGVERVTPLDERDGRARFTVVTAECEDVRRAIFKACAGNDIAILEMSPHRVSLEDAFISITTSEENEVVQ